QSENVLNEYEYDAWGEVTHQRETIENRFKFNGQQLDTITGQYYLRVRFYNPVIARFTQEDTYRGDGLNLYAYCRNNPVYYVDPTGNSCKSKGEVLADNKTDVTSNPKDKGIENYSNTQNQPDRPSAKEAKTTDSSEERSNKRYKYFDDAPIQWTATNERGTGQTYRVFQRNDIDWNRVRTNGAKKYQGMTNAAAAQKGLAPELNDGSLATLHHLGQDSRGGLVEASTRYHGVGKYGQDILHSQFGRNKPNPNFPINRKQFQVDTKEYWIWRSNNR
ncbi:MAG: RHS repeat-associated core domain-containing protein, partial [Eubacteriales bacterium]